MFAIALLIALTAPLQSLAAGWSAGDVQMHASPLPARTKGCANTTIAAIGTRLEADGRPVPGSGVSVRFANHLGVVGYEGNRVAGRERRGDKVQTCLIAVPKNCPPGDDRGKIYRVYDYKQHSAYVLPDSQHSCGGA